MAKNLENRSIKIQDLSDLSVLSTLTPEVMSEIIQRMTLAPHYGGTLELELTQPANKEGTSYEPCLRATYILKTGHGITSQKTILDIVEFYAPWDLFGLDDLFN